MLTDAEWDKISRDQGRSNVREPTDAEREEATRRLRKVVGRKASSPELQTRLRMRADTNQPVLAVCEHFALRGGATEEAPWSDPSALMSPLCYFSLEDGASRLRDGEPETVIEARRQRIDEHEKAARARFDKSVAALVQMTGGTQEQREAGARERERWSPGRWSGLSPVVRAALLLAYAVEGRDPALAGDLKAVARAMNASGAGPCPSREWWNDLGIRC